MWLPGGLVESEKKIPKDQWLIHLNDLLTGPVLGTFQYLTQGDWTSFERVKEKLLASQTLIVEGWRLTSSTCRWQIFSDFITNLNNISQMWEILCQNALPSRNCLTWLSKTKSLRHVMQVCVHSYWKETQNQCRTWSKLESGASRIQTFKRELIWTISGECSN